MHVGALCGAGVPVVVYVLSQHGEPHGEMEPVENVLGAGRHVRRQVPDRVAAIGQGRDVLVHLQSLFAQHLAEPPVDRAARERRFHKPCVGVEPFHRHLETPSGVVVIEAGRILADQYPLDGVRDQRQVVHGVQARRSPPAGRRPHRRYTAGSACRRPQAGVPRREARAPTRRTCRRRTGTWRSCETGTPPAARRSTPRTGPVPRIGRREWRTRTGGCLPTPSRAGRRRAARAATQTPARGRGARSSG